MTYRTLALLCCDLDLEGRRLSACAQIKNEASVWERSHKALCEMGNALKTMILLSNLQLEELHRELHEGLQVSENWNRANDLILYGGSRDNGIFDQMTDLPWFVNHFCPS